MADGITNTEGDLNLDLTKDKLAEVPDLSSSLEQTLGQDGSDKAVLKISALPEGGDPAAILDLQFQTPDTKQIPPVQVSELPAADVVANPHEKTDPDPAPVDGKDDAGTGKDKSTEAADLLPKTDGEDKTDKPSENTEEADTAVPKEENLTQEQKDEKTIAEMKAKLQNKEPLTKEERQAAWEAHERLEKAGESKAYNEQREKLLEEQRALCEKDPSQENLERLAKLEQATDMRSVEGINIRMDMLYKKIKDKGDIQSEDIADLMVLRGENEDAFVNNITQRSMSLLIEDLFNPKNNEGGEPLKITKEISGQLQELLKIVYSEEQLGALSVKLTKMAEESLKETQAAEKDLEDAAEGQDKREKTLEFVKKAQKLNAIYDRLVQVQIQYDTVAENFTIAFAKVRQNLGMANGFTTFFRVAGASISSYAKRQSHNITSYIKGSFAYNHLKEAGTAA